LQAVISQQALEIAQLKIELAEARARLRTERSEEQAPIDEARQGRHHPQSPYPSEADARTRTGDPIITSDVLYQLSYVGAAITLAGLRAGGGARGGDLDQPAPWPSRPGRRPFSSASATLKRWRRIAFSAFSPSPAITASTIAACSAWEAGGRPGMRIVRYW
jgi:hypothetical protein